MSDVLVIDDFLDSPARTRILSALQQADSVPAPVQGGAKPGADQRVRSARALHVSDEVRELVKARFLHVKPRLASHFDVVLGECEEPQFLRYLPGDFFVAHQDGNTPMVRDDTLGRRVSVIAFLNESYSGGELQLHGRYPDWERRDVVPATPGTLVAFRSETTHEVTPVTEGERYTIVSWFRA